MCKVYFRQEEEKEEGSMSISCANYLTELGFCQGGTFWALAPLSCTRQVSQATVLASGRT